jgi:2-polyprenyl-6-hydroxyphenyl methylase/3-demethylubiquinone-9 3-methyltransferase
MSKIQSPVDDNLRFKFGENWRKYIANLDEDSICVAKKSLQEGFNVENLNNKSFLDIGSGSGLFSLAARKLGATVFSFDFDLASVACTAELKRRYFENDPNWKIEPGSILDNAYIANLPQFDFVYSWGVLHHTGSMWEAINNAARLVKEGGYIFIAIYNDQGGMSKFWLNVKKLYNRSPIFLQYFILVPFLIRLWGPTILRDSFHGDPMRTWKNYGKMHRRGMGAWRNLIDWVGGLPFEVAKPEEIFQHFSGEKFSLVKITTCAGGHGCNEFVFKKINSVVGG